MKKPKPTLDEILKSDPFYDGGNTNLDLSGFPHLQPGPEDESPIDERFAPLDTRGQGIGSSGLKEFLANPDSDSLAEVGKRDPKLRQKLEEEHAEAVANAFRAKRPDYFRSADNYTALVQHLAVKHLRKDYLSDSEAVRELTAAQVWTVENLESAFHTLTQRGELEVRPGQIKQLTKEEADEVVAAIHSEGPETAVIQYIIYALGGKMPEYESPREFLAQNAELASRAAEFVWLNSRPNACDSAEWRAYKEQRLAGKRLVTVRMLDEIWKQFEKEQARSALFREVPADRESEPPQPSLDELSDADVERLMSGTLKAHAQQVKQRRGGGILS